MVLSQRYEPTEGELLYHYCTPNSFIGICSTKQIWFSDAFSMNDSMEFHWGYRIFENAATQLIRSKEIDVSFIDKIDSIVSTAGSQGVALLTCLSMDGDMLSQWRAYTDDGRGFSIGMSASDLKQLPATLLKVEYDERAQLHEVITFIRAIHSVEKELGFTFDTDFRTHCMTLAFDLCAFKNPAFAEEREVRLVHLATLVKSGAHQKITGSPGTAWGKKSKPYPIQYRAKGEILAPYAAIDYSNSGKNYTIKKVILGPKNHNMVTNVQIFLETLGHKSVTVERSAASYV